jgi:hypothetical protein
MLPLKFLKSKWRVVVLSPDYCSNKVSLSSNTFKNKTENHFSPYPRNKSMAHVTYKSLTPFLMHNLFPKKKKMILPSKFNVNLKFFFFGGGSK